MGWLTDLGSLANTVNDANKSENDKKISDNKLEEAKISKQSILDMKQASLDAKMAGASIVASESNAFTKKALIFGGVGGAILIAVLVLKK